MRIVAILFMTLSVALAIPNEPVVNATQCVFNPETRIFGCQGVSGLVECPAIFEYEGESIYSLFGIGTIPEVSDAVVGSSVRYFLYPRSLDNATYISHRLITKDGARDLFLYNGESFVEFGFRVTELSCYERLVALIRLTSVERMCEVASEEADVPMIGEVLVVGTSEVTKRWGYGYGFGGLGYGGLGYGGLYGGYGLGYGGLYGLYGR
jgi:hypothetical protein